MADRPSALRHAVVLTLVAAGLHGAWEIVQCPLFFVHGSVKPTIGAMMIATAGDVFMTWVAYSLIAIQSKEWLWSLGAWKRAHWLVMEVSAIVMSTAVEVVALRSGRWSYTDINPTIPGTPISLLPVVQLVILFPLSFGIVKRHFPSRRRRHLT